MQKVRLVAIDSINNVKFKVYNSSYQTAPNFKAQSLQPLNNDTVEISVDKKPEEKKKLSTLQKWGIGIGSTIAALLTAGILISKHETGKLTKLYKEKMTLVNLPEKLEFKEAKTLDEGIKFAKEVLGIEKVREGFTLDAINYVNKGLIEVSNANKGKLFMPKTICFEEMDDAVAYVIPYVNNPRFGEFSLNKKYFDNEFLTKRLSKIYKVDAKIDKQINETVQKVTKGEKSTELNLVGNFSTYVRELGKRFKQDPKSLSIEEKRELFYNRKLANTFGDSLIYGSPLSTLRKYAQRWDKCGIKIDEEEFKKLSNKEQSEKLKEYILQVQEKEGGRFVVDIPLYSSMKTVYHEMGHLQDFAKNLKELDIAKWKLPSFKEIWNDVKNGTRKADADIEHVDNRWGGLTYSGFKDLFDKDPKKFMKRYPDLYEFLTNQEYQQTAGKISRYAKTSIGEFIAETYAEMIRLKNEGKKLSEDILNLYRKYNGPELP